MEASGQIQAPAALPLEKKPPVHIKAAERTPEPTWMFWRRETSLAHCENRIPNYPSSSVDNILSELPRIRLYTTLCLLI